MWLKKILLIAATAIAIASCTGTQEKQCPPLPYDSLRNGDIVFRTGCNYTSRLILSRRDRYNYSHIGIVQKSDSGWCVIHAVNDEPQHANDFDRVKIDKIESFFAPSRATAGEIMHSSVSRENAEKISELAMELLKDSVPFDADFDTDDHSRLYCTEFIYFLYKSIGEDITEGRRTPVGILSFPDEIIFPSDIYENKMLKSFYIF